MRTLTSHTSHGSNFQELVDELSESMIDYDFVRLVSDGKRHRQKHCVPQKRRRVPKPSHPGYGMGARRNHGWTW
jgi:hypothetical protein